MKRTRAALVSTMAAASLLATGTAQAETPSTGCGSEPMASGIYQIADGDLTRTYRLHVPAGYDANKPAPVALVFHGWSDDENALLGNPAVTAAADAQGFILVAPRGIGSEGVDQSNNSFTFRGSATGLGGDGLPICDDAKTTDYVYKSCGPVGEGVAKSACAWTQCQTDDVAFVKALVAEIEGKACVDKDRVFATGASNGGMFTWELGQNPDTAPMLRAIAPIIGLPHRGYLDGPGRTDGLPVLVITGKNDPTVPPGAWENPAHTTSFDGDFYDYTGATAITRTWAAAQGCAADKPAEPVDVGIEGVECRSYCGATPAGAYPTVLDCRMETKHDSNAAVTFPLILQFFQSQQTR